MSEPESLRAKKGQTNLTRILRILIITEIVLMIVGIASEFLTVNMLSPQLRELKEAQDEAAPLILAPIGLVILIVCVIAWIGLWRFWSFGRQLYLSTLVISLILSAFAGPYISTGITDSLEAAGVAVSGAILGLIYFSDLATMFPGGGAR